MLLNERSWIQGGEDSQDPLSLYVIFRKRALYLVALLWKMICNLGDPMSLRHPVDTCWHCIFTICIYTIDDPEYMPHLQKIKWVTTRRFIRNEMSRCAMRVEFMSLDEMMKLNRHIYKTHIIWIHILFIMTLDSSRTFTKQKSCRCVVRVELMSLDGWSWIDTCSYVYDMYVHNMNNRHVHKIYNMYMICIYITYIIITYLTYMICMWYVYT